jgi:putative hydrolase of HD superfamily
MSTPTREEYERLMSLKCLARTGWMQRGVPAPLAETVAAHSFEAAVLAYLLASRTGIVDPGKAAAAAVFHDAAEGLVGDIPLWSSSRMEGFKERLEEEAFKELGLEDMLGLLGKDELRYVVRIADLLATALQAKRYMSSGYKGVYEIYETARQAACRLIAEGLAQARSLAEELLGEKC